jgi:hypothetical protein
MDIARGLDTRSTPNLIPDGYSRILKNVLTNSEGFVQKRPGYQGYYGYIPLRVLEVEYTNDVTENILLTLDSAINLDVVEQTPLIVHGRLSNTTMDGDFTSAGDTTEYYTTFATTQPISLPVGTGTLTRAAAETGISSNAIAVGLARLLDVGQSNSWIYPDEVSVDAASYEVNIDYTNGESSAVDTYLYFKDKTASAGTIYHATGADLSIPASDVDTGAETFTSVAHGLYTGDIVEFTATTGGYPGAVTDNTDYYVIRVDADTFQLAFTLADAEAGTEINITSTGAGTHTLSRKSITVPATTHNLTNFNILMQFEELTGGAYSQFLPDYASIHAASGDVYVEWSETISSFRVILTAVAPANRAVGSASQGTSGITFNSTDAFPFTFAQLYREDGDYLELVIPDNQEFYEDQGRSAMVIQSSFGGDSYEVYWEAAELVTNTLKVTGTVNVTGTDTAPQLCVWGLSHVGLYNSTAERPGHVNHIDSYKRVGEQRLLCGLGGNLFSAKQASELGAVTPEVFANLRGRVDSDTGIAPLFWESGAQTARTRGTIETSATTDNTVAVTAAEYNSGTGYVEYTVHVPDIAILDIDNVPTTLSAVISTTTGLEDWLTVEGMLEDQLNGTFKIMGVSAPSASTLLFEVDNTQVSSSAFDEDSSVGTAGVFTDQIITQTTTEFAADDTVNLADGFEFNDELVIKSVSSSTHVVGDVYEYDFLSNGVRLFGTRTSSTFPLRDSSGAATTEWLVKGDMLSITGLTRNVRIVSVDSAENTVTLDESITLTDPFDDATVIQPIGRWYPIEKPYDSYDITPATKSVFFDADVYTDQDPLRSTMVQDSMLFTNYNDEVYKFDGSSLYRAGLPRWQAGLFATLTTGVTSFTPSSTTTVGASTTGSQIKVGSGVGLFAAGDTVYYAADSAFYTVKSVDLDNEFVYINESVVNTSNSTLTLVEEYKYYARLNAIDANNNVVASATIGNEDLRVRVYTNCQIQLKFVGLPAWDIYDYDRIELQIFRTKANLSAPYYQIGTVVESFDNYEGYITFQDGIVDQALSLEDLDQTISVIKGEKLAPFLDEPMRAKYITSAGGKLILGNVRGYPTIDLVFRKKATDTLFAAADLVASNESRYLFRKDNTDTGTTTNMTDRIAYKFVNSGAVTITPASEITTTATTFTVTETDIEGTLAAGDWVYMFHSAAGLDNDLTFAGWWQVASVASNTFTVNCTNHGRGVGGGTASDVDRFVYVSGAPEDVPVWVGTDGNRNQRLANLTDRDISTEAALRLAEAINCTMRVTDLSVSTTFEPWLLANAGFEFGRGRCIIEQPKVLSTSFELVLDSAVGTTYNVFANNIIREASEQVGAQTLTFPSRVLVSYENFPEMFDNPTGTPAASGSAVDINPADGQEVTGVIPFFSDSTFGDATREATVVVFKTQSIYVLDSNTRKYQKVDSQGLGCTAPYSITPTRNGVMFANRSGVYRLNYDLTITYVGKNIEGIWKDDVNRDELSSAAGHHYANERRYELSVTTDSDFNSNVLVYDHTREGRDQELGAWTEFTNIPATGWANLDDDAYFASTLGEVFKIRRAGDNTDYRDDASAVAEMQIVTKPFTFGAFGLRHKLRMLLSYFKMDADMVGTSLSTAVDLSTNFEAVETFNIEDLDSTSPFAGREVVALRSSIATPKFLFLQLKYTNSTKDEPVILAGIAFKAAPLSHQGLQQGANTTVTQ